MALLQFGRIQIFSINIRMTTIETIFIHWFPSHCYLQNYVNYTHNQISAAVATLLCGAYNSHNDNMYVCIGN